MTELTPALLRRIPKAELHCHLDGSVRPTTLLELGAEHGIPMPAATPEALAHHMYVRDARHLEDYLTRFDVTLSVMQSDAALERIAFELAADATLRMPLVSAFSACPFEPDATVVDPTARPM